MGMVLSCSWCLKVDIQLSGIIPESLTFVKHILELSADFADFRRLFAAKRHPDGSPTSRDWLRFRFAQLGAKGIMNVELINFEFRRDRVGRRCRCQCCTQRNTSRFQFVHCSALKKTPRTLSPSGIIPNLYRQAMFFA